MAKKTKPTVSDDGFEIIGETPFKENAPKNHAEELGVLKMAEDNSRPYEEPKDSKVLGILHMDDGLSGAEEKPEFKEITLKFAKGLVGDEFQAKDGNTYREIKIPNKDENDSRPWMSFVARSNRIHEDQFHKGGMWLKLPAEGHTTVKRDIIVGERPDGKHDWKREMEQLPNKEIKKMLDETRPRSSFKDKLNEKQEEIKANNAAKAIDPVAKTNRTRQEVL
ncbi:MAG: hypothetical protein K6A45_10080 [Lachnospiraceae bacterium]|nr:hypothetical protein [Lachnospiraceae bacterium]